MVPLSCHVMSQQEHFKRDWFEIFKVMKNKDLQPRLLFPTRLSLKNLRGNKELPRKKKKLKEFCYPQTSSATNIKKRGLLGGGGEGREKKKRKRNRKRKKEKNS